MKKLMMMIAAALCGMALFAASFANGEKVYVAEKTAKVKASTGLFAKTVATAEYGDVATVLKSESKKTQIKIGNTTGWIANSALTTKKIVKAGGSSVLASTEELALAGKGNIKATEDKLNDLEAQGEAAIEEIKDATIESAEQIKEAVRTIDAK